MSTEQTTLPQGLVNVGGNVIDRADHLFTDEEIIYSSYQGVTIGQLRAQHELVPEHVAGEANDLTLDALIGGIHNDESKKPSGEATQPTGTE